MGYEHALADSNCKQTFQFYPETPSWAILHMFSNQLGILAAQQSQNSEELDI